jgi:hypothetical protein
MHRAASFDPAGTARDQPDRDECDCQVAGGLVVQVWAWS